MTSQEPIRPKDFRIGEVFWSGGRRWRCTDVGTRVIVAIRLDAVAVATFPSGGDKTLDEAEAEAEGWFRGPPYAVAESAFDEDALQGCTKEPETHGAAAASDVVLPEPPEEHWFSPRTLARLKAQASALRERARAGGLCFEAYLPPSLAEWLLSHVERDNFRDPSEAVFVMLGEQQELEPHTDLRNEVLSRSLDKAAEAPFITGKELRAHLDAKAKAPLPAPAIWRKTS